MLELPSGLVTFLFTDIEGSTRLWEEQPDTMQLALERHDVLLRQAIEKNGGVVFKTVGDAFSAVFPTASQAVEAALMGQQSLRSSIPAAVSDQLDLKVRMSLHSGEAQARASDYFGPTLNRLARLLAITHGGQILLSGAVRALLPARLPDRLSLQDRGSHRLKDLQQPEEVYQLHHPDLPADFPPLRSLSTHPNNLPQQLSSFIGRGAQIRDVSDLMARTHLLTLTGSGGCGKTRLALQAAAELLERYPDGVWLTELASLSDPSLVPQTVADALEMREEPGKSPEQQLVEHLRNKQTLLLLDNCEHLVFACAKLAETLLRACSGVNLLCTSREALGITGETTYRIPPLSHPHPGSTPVPEDLRTFEAVRLFEERAVAVAREFSITGHNAPAVLAICSRLDGIPLAIELAAARVRAMPVEQIASLLDDCFRLLAGGSRTAPPRQQTLRAAIDWSYGLLNEQERVLLNRLSVFAGGWTLEAAESVCASGETERPREQEMAGQDASLLLLYSSTPLHSIARSPLTPILPYEVLDLLTSLVDKSLVVYEQKDGAARYGLLETIRQYALAHLIERGEQEIVRRRHRDWFLQLAVNAAPELKGANQRARAEQLEADRDNLQAALSWCVESPEGGEPGLCMVGSLSVWLQRSHFREGLARLKAALAHPEGQAATRARGDALNGAGFLCARLGDKVAARKYYMEALEIRQAVGDRFGAAMCLNNLGSIAQQHDRDLEAARRLHEESLSVLRDLDEPWGLALAGNNLGTVLYEQRKYEEARVILQESLVHMRQLGDRHEIARVLDNLGLVTTAAVLYPEARTMLREGLAIRRELDDRHGIAESLDSLAALLAAEARDRSLSDAEGPETAALLWGANDRLRTEIGAPMEPCLLPQYERDITTVRDALGDEAFQAALTNGRELPLHEVVSLVLSDNDA